MPQKFSPDVLTVWRCSGRLLAFHVPTWKAKAKQHITPQVKYGAGITDNRNYID